MEYRLFCIVLGEKAPFQVEIDKDQSVDKLKDEIKKKEQHRFKDLDADELTLYLLNVGVWKK